MQFYSKLEGLLKTFGTSLKLQIWENILINTFSLSIFIKRMNVSNNITFIIENTL